MPTRYPIPSPALILSLRYTRFTCLLLWSYSLTSPVYTVSWTCRRGLLVRPSDPNSLPYSPVCIHLVCIAPYSYWDTYGFKWAVLCIHPQLSPDSLRKYGAHLNVALHVLSGEKMANLSVFSHPHPTLWFSALQPHDTLVLSAFLLLGTFIDAVFSALPQPTLHSPLHLLNACWTNSLPRPTPHHENLSVLCSLFQFVNFNLFLNDLNKCLTSSRGKTLVLGWTKSSLQKI